MKSDRPAEPTPIGWAFLFALAREAAPFVRPLTPVMALPNAPCSAWLYDARGRPVLVLETGVGADRAGRAIAWVLDRFAPRLVVSAGFAGALAPNLGIGDVVVASRVVEPEDVAWQVSLPAELGDLECGRVFTGPQLVTTAAAKLALREETGAIAVDMESGAIAEACAARRVPCACVRAISDVANQDMSPDLVRLLVGSDVSVPRVIAAVARRPRLIGELWRLRRATRFAARNLARALSRLVA